MPRFLWGAKVTHKQQCESRAKMVDQYDDGKKVSHKDRLKPSNIKEKPKRQTAVALQESEELGDAPTITAAGRGIIAEKILQLAFENGINVREDSALAEMLAKIELDSPIPSEAFMAVAEILSYVYQANGQADPFNVTFEDDKNEGNSEQDINDNG